MSWLPLLLAAAAAASEPRLLDQCLNNDAGGAGAFYKALSPAERADFRSLFAAYEANVAKRKAEGWSHGLRGNFWTNLGNSWSEHGFWKGLFAEARTYDDSRTKLEAELEKAHAEELKATRALAGAQDNAQLQRVLASAHKRRRDLEELADNRSFGRCHDWAMDTRDVLRAVGQKSFAIDTRIHVSAAALGDSGSHIFATACRAASASSCLAFDPWMRGDPELASIAEQDKGASQAYTCFKANKPAF